MNQPIEDNERKNYVLTGFVGVLLAIAVVVGLIVTAFVGLAMLGFSRTSQQVARNAQVRQETAAKLKQVGLALHAYHSQTTPPQPSETPSK